MNEILVPPVDAFDKYMDLEDELFPEARGGGGGGKKKNARRDKDSETAKAIGRRVVEDANENRREDAQKNLKKVFEDFPHFDNDGQEERFLAMYVPWLNLSLESGEPMIDEVDLEEEFMRSGKKAGGQNVNKVNSAVRIKHVPTNISVRNEETRDQGANRQNARAGLKNRLEAHLTDWKTYLGEGKKEVTSNLIKELQ